MSLVVTLPPSIQSIVDQAYPVPRQMLADQLAQTTHPLFFIFTAFQLAFLLWFYFSAESARVRSAIESKVKNPVAAAIIFLGLVFVGFSLAMLPLSFYGGFVLAHEFGLSNEGVLRWLRDWLVALVLSAIIVSLCGAAFLRIVARFRAWPVIAAAGTAAVLLFGNAIFPLFIAPLFNHYTPLPPSSLTRAILALAASQGIQASVVYQFDMSAQTNEVNAYVSGLGRTERIALGDTTLRSMKPDEVIFVMAHEMGHYKLGHLWILTGEAWALIVAGILIVSLIGAKVARRNPRLSRGLSDPAIAPLLAALVIAYELLTMPAANAMSRSIEHAADNFAGEHADVGDAGVRAQARLASLDLSPLHPSPIWVWFFYTHPPSDQRIMDAARAAHLVP